MDASEPTAGVALTLAFGRALHVYGASAPRVEQSMGLLAARFGLEGQFFATPTSIFAAFGKEGEQRTSLLRVEPGSVDLGKRAELDELIQAVLAGRVDPVRARAALERIQRENAVYPLALRILCSGLCSASAARFFGGGATEIAASLGAGILVALLARALVRAHAPARLLELAAAVCVSFGALALSVRLDTLSTYTVTASGLIVLLPGLALTTAMSELAMQHLASGTARFMGALLSLLTLTFGVALGRRLGDLAGWSEPALGSHALAPWTLWVALVVAPVCFSVLLRARLRDFGWIWLAGIAAFFGARLGAHVLGPELGAGIGALVAGAGSNLYARKLQRPSAVVLVPGILLLVPGSIGLQSLATMLQQDVVSGLETGFRMVLVAISLAAGLLLANTLVPPRSSER